MKLLLIIDHLGLGGAQRQMVELACGMKRRGHEVEMFTYFPQYDFFRPAIDECAISLHEYEKGRGFSFGVLAKLISLLRARHFDVVVSFLSSPNIYAELTVPFACSAKLVVSERVGHQDDKSLVGDHLKRVLHFLSDAVVANSRTHCEWLKQRWWLRGRAKCIYNGLNLQAFSPANRAAGAARSLHLIAIGRISPQKNILNLIAALALLQAESGDSPQISWVGPREESDTDKEYSRRIDQALEALPEIRRRWQWLGSRTDVPSLLRSHDALIHPSFYEGLPNVVCEALASGVPVLASNVCDHSFLVADGERGFLFDPASPQSIAKAIARFRTLDAGEQQRFSRNARQYAEDNLGVEKMVSAYESLFARLVEAG